MAIQSLAVKYRPKTFDDVSEQSSIKLILEQQLKTNSTKNAYLFCGGAGTGKTTCARIFANEINKGNGQPIELDAASNNSVDDVREIITQSKTQSLDSEYKVFIIDECHALSNSAWQAMLKVLEEPPKKSIFIMCTTDPQKIPKTILSRVQRYDFQRISHTGIVGRLKHILIEEGISVAYIEAVEYIAKIADGGMRDAITLLDKCLAYSHSLTVDNVVKALGTVDYDTMYKLTDCVIGRRVEDCIKIIEDVHMSGKDLKQFIKNYMAFLLDVCKYDLTKSDEYIQIPSQLANDNTYNGDEMTIIRNLLRIIVSLNADIKWDSNPKVMIETTFYLAVKK